MTRLSVREGLARPDALGHNILVLAQGIEP